MSLIPPCPRPETRNPKPSTLNPALPSLLPAVKAAPLAEGTQGVGKGVVHVVEQHLIPAVLSPHGQGHDLLQSRLGVDCRDGHYAAKAPSSNLTKNWWCARPITTVPNKASHIVKNWPGAARVLLQELVPGERGREVRDKHPGEGEAHTCRTRHWKHEAPAFTQVACRGAMCPKAKRTPTTRGPPSCVSPAEASILTRTPCCTFRSHRLRGSSSTTQA